MALLICISLGFYLFSYFQAHKNQGNSAKVLPLSLKCVSLSLGYITNTYTYLFTYLFPPIFESGENAFTIQHEIDITEITGFLEALPHTQRPVL